VVATTPDTMPKIISREIETVSDYPRFRWFLYIRMKIYRVIRKSSKNIQEVIDVEWIWLICTG